MGKDKKEQNKRWFTPFGETPYGLAAADGIKGAIAVAPFALLFGYLHRGWGAGASKDLAKSQKTIKSLLTISPGAPKEAEDKRRVKEPRAILTTGIQWTTPFLTAGSMYLLGIALADKHRKNSEGVRITNKLKQAENEYDQVLHSRLYPAVQQEPEPFDQQTESPLEDTRLADALAGVMPSSKAAKDDESTTGPEYPFWMDQNIASLPGAGVIFLGSGLMTALAYSISRRWTDANDPNRKRAKEIRNAIENRATKRWIPKLTLDAPQTTAELDKEHAARIGQ